MRYMIPMLLLSLTANADKYFDERERGWFWYEDPVVEKPISKKPMKEPTAIAAPTQQPLAPREVLKQQGEQWEDALALAILEPSMQNYRDYLEKTTQIQAQSQQFATGFSRAIWQMPEFDYSLQAPHSPQAIAAKADKTNAQKDARLRELADNTGMLFFFRSDCPYCHRFAPILKQFADQYGFTVIPISLDGKGLPEYPYPKRNHHLGSRLKVSAVPAVFMVRPEGNKVASVAYGFNGMTQLIQKVLYGGDLLDGKGLAQGGIQ